MTIIDWSHGHDDNISKDTCWYSTKHDRWAVTLSRRRKSIGVGKAHSETTVATTAALLHSLREGLSECFNTFKVGGWGFKVSNLAEVCSCKLGVGAQLLLNSEQLVVFRKTLRPVQYSLSNSLQRSSINQGRSTNRPQASILNRDLQGAPVLIWPVPSPTTRSAMKQSSVSPDLINGIGKNMWKGSSFNPVWGLPGSDKKHIFQDEFHY